ncbi:sodium/glutamate symporter, partial [Klebsiella pneumoniae]
IQGAVTLGIACATFGLVIGGLIGGPLAKALITRRRLAVHDPAAAPEKQPPLGESASHGGFENPEQTRLITTSAAIETLALFAGCLGFAEFM